MASISLKNETEWNIKEKRTPTVFGALRRTCLVLVRVTLGAFLLGSFSQVQSAPSPTSTHLPDGPDLVTPAQLRTGYNYLIKYGFLPKPNPIAGSLRSLAELTEGIQAFQEFYGLPVTGAFDPETAALMSKRRCGLPDIMRDDDGEDADARRKRRYVHTGAKWNKEDITYRIMNYSPDLTEAETDEVIARALKLWSNVIPVNFHRRTIGSADIEISFASGLHRDDYPFDGAGGTLAHAFFPGDDLGGDAHFDDDEEFTVKSYTGTNLFIVAAHEFGHSLGMGHSSDLTSLMAAFYQGYKPNYVLPYDDHLGIQHLYGARPGSVPSRPVDTAPGPQQPEIVTPDPNKNPRCGGSYNTIAKIRGELMLFKGKTFWRMTERGHPLEGYPIDTDRFWDQLPSKLDASYERIDSKIIFFKGASYWEYSGTSRDPSFPRPIRELGLPDDIDAALPWGDTGKTYFFKGEQYWRYDELKRQVDVGYPKSIHRNWGSQVPVDMDTAFRFVDAQTDTWYTYFVRNKKYWQFDESRGKVDKGYPRSFDENWMGCADQANLVEDSTVKGGDNDAVEPPKTQKVTGPNSNSSRTACCLTHVLLFVLFSLFITG